ncbi:hypothetical protein [Clostridium sp. JS66]|uniref:hypothetical protein n=1 Tax=Clostridium sp. JS66 TaxID=3064705 RepID=UPI00298E06E1|nr:hypothetical protein [Clostridium sp. JS66]WPC43373.1 hypothetical protein Q6H37_07850 [Clostridium sp. JS66]
MEELVLNERLSKAIHDLMRSTNQYYEQKNYDKILATLKQAWYLLPLPKENYDESFHLAEAICEVYIMLNNFEEAVLWSNQLFKCATFRIDSGERYFLAAKVLFGMKDYERARKYFSAANEMSDGRCFEDEDRKYVNFFRKGITND